MTITEALQICKNHKKSVFPEFDRYRNKWQIVVQPWDFERSKPILTAKKKELNIWFGRDECKTNQSNPTPYQIAIEDVIIKLANYLLNKK